jgi:tetratricopeptide (TPR) repeat protein
MIINKKNSSYQEYTQLGNGRSGPYIAKLEGVAKLIHAAANTQQQQEILTMLDMLELEYCKQSKQLNSYFYEFKLKLLSKMRNFEGLIATAETAISKSLASDYVIFRYFDALNKSGKYEEVLAFSKKRKDLVSQDSRVEAMISKAFLETEKQAQDKNKAVYQKRAWLLIDSGRFDQAAELLERLIAIDKNDAVTHQISATLNSMKLGFWRER